MEWYKIIGLIFSSIIALSVVIGFAKARELGGNPLTRVLAVFIGIPLAGLYMCIILVLHLLPLWLTFKLCLHVVNMFALDYNLPKDFVFQLFVTALSFVPMGIGVLIYYFRQQTFNIGDYLYSYYRPIQVITDKFGFKD